jgi:hypothetical protein
MRLTLKEEREGSDDSDGDGAIFFHRTKDR